MTRKEIDIIESCFSSFICNSIYIRMCKIKRDDCICENIETCKCWSLKLTTSFSIVEKGEWPGKKMIVTESDVRKIATASQWLRELYLMELKGRMDND